MRTERDFDRRKSFYALRKFRWSNRLYMRGDKFPARDVTNRKLRTLFQNGRVGYAEDFSSNKTDRKAVQLEEDTRQAEETTESQAENEPETVETDSGKATVVVDNDEEFKVEYKGKTFEINRNQIRDDGTLTAGGLKAYEKAE